MFTLLKARSFKKLCFNIRSYNCVVAGAVRTPILSCADGTPLEKQNLASLCIDEVIKRSTLPKEDIGEVHLIGFKEEPNELKSMCGQLGKNVRLVTEKNTITAFLNIIQNLQAEKTKAAIICSVESNEHVNITEKMYKTFENIATNFDSELMSIKKRRNRSLVTIAKDHVPLKMGNLVSLAASVALTTSENANKLNIQPLANLYNLSENVKDMKIFFASHGFTSRSVDYWELLTTTDISQSSKCISEHETENVKNLVTKIFCQLPNVALIASMAHLIHKLKSKETACIGIRNKNNSLDAILLDKSTSESFKGLPILTLYTTTTMCPLCDKFIEELEQNFKMEYTLEKVFINRKENVRFLRLFRNDIPVLFLNGQFVCMHRLDKNLLRKKLLDLKENKYC